MRDDYHGLHTLHASTWCYALPSILLLHAADRRCLTRENRNQNQIICRKSNWNRSKLKIGNRNSTKVMATLLEIVKNYLWRITYTYYVYLPSKKTIIGQYYAEIMFQLYDSIKHKRRGNCHRVFGFFTTMHQFTIHLLYCKLFATVDFFYWTILPTVKIWLLVTVIRNLKSHLHGPSLQRMNHQKLLLKRGMKGRTENLFFKE